MARIFLPDAIMPSRFSVPLASALLALLLTLLSVFHPFSAPDCRAPAYQVRLEISSPHPLTISLHPSTEAGLLNGFTSYFEVAGSGATETIKLPLPNVDLFGLGLLWKRGAGPLRFLGARITTPDGRTVLKIPPQQWNYRGPERDIEWALSGAPEVAYEKPFLSVKFPELPAVDSHKCSPAHAALTFAITFGILLACARLLAPLRTRALSAAARTADFCRRRPRLAIATAAALSVLAACHPVIFFGKSFVSPNNGMQVFASTSPTVAGAPVEPLENPSGADLGAMINWGMPATAVQHRAIFGDGEMPFWNRNSWLGTTLLGQLQSMAGDPLHWLPLATGGSAIAWDVKFILARIAFAIGVGFLAWAACRHAGVSVLLAASAPWIGFFTYRGCHMAVFTMCYAPWILVAWLEAARAGHWRGARGWALLLLFADWWVLCSGTAKEASAMLVFLNLAGGLAMLLQPQAWRVRAAKLALMAWVSVLFLLISAPQWLVFLDALKKANTAYEELAACQIQPSLVIGLFDDIFYRQLCERDFVFNPCTNLLVLAGLAWLFSRPRAAFADRTVTAVTATTVFAACFAFGVISPALLKSLPFLDTVHHFDNTFSCVLIVLFFPLAALGLKRCTESVAKPGWWGDWALTLGAVALMVMAYFGFMHATHRVGFNPLPDKQPLPVSDLFLVLVPLLLAAFAAFAPALRATLAGGPWRAPGVIILTASLAVIHFRHGQWLVTGFDRLVFNPKTRFDFRETKSPALAWLSAAQKKEPGRAVGLGDTMIPGQAAMYGIEDISGADALRVAGARELIEALEIPLFGWRTFVPARLLQVLRRRLDFLNVRHYAMEKDPTVAPPDGFPVAFAGDMTVYESPTAWPRAFFTDAAFPAASVQDVAKVLRDGDGRPFAAIAPQTIERLRLPNAASGTHTAIAASGYRLTANSTEFVINAPTRGLAVLHEVFSPGDIEVTVDGESSVTLRANHAFRAVPILAPGRHVVRFTFVPAVWRRSLGMCVTGLGLLALSALLLTRYAQGAGTRAAN
jgi:hypothetical protein